MLNKIAFESHLGYIIPILLLSFLLSYFLYRKDTRIPDKLKYWLAGIRFVLISLLLILLLNPVLQLLEKKIEKPLFVVAIDNSESVGSHLSGKGATAFNTFLQTLKEDFYNGGIEFSSITMSKQKEEVSDDISFDIKSTDLNALLQNVSSKFENRNIAGVLLISDGLYNRGISPLYQDYSYPISSLGIGDTNSIRDLRISKLTNNDIAYLGNNFLLEVEIQHKGFDNENFVIDLIENGKSIQKKKYQFSQNENYATLNFEIPSSSVGQKRYTIELKSDVEEKNIINNKRDAYVEIIEGRDNVLIVALSPHPDIKMLNRALEKKDNYKVDVFYPGNTKQDLSDNKYDLVIFHQIPNSQKIGQGIYEKFLAEDTHLWFILGPESDTYELNRKWKTLRISTRGNQIDEVNATINLEFPYFKIPDGAQELFKQLPPIKVPFANFDLGENSEVLVFQRIGNIDTEKPLISLHEEAGRKFGFMAGDGLWRWRMQEYTFNENTNVTDELISKIVQYLSLKDDKRKFRISLVDGNSIVEDQALQINTTIYNDIYEPVFGKKVNLNIENEAGDITNFTYLNNEEDFVVRGLNPGIYKYQASTLLPSGNELVEGQFSVSAIQLEAMTSQANFDLLKNIADKTGGIFIDSMNAEILTSIVTEQSQGIIHTRTTNKDGITLFWLFFVFLILISIEWFVRKYVGAY